VASIRKRRGRFEVRWRDRRGQRSQTFTRRADAERFKLEVERKAQLGGLFEAEPMFFSEFLDGWLDRFEQRVRPSRTSVVFRRSAPCGSLEGGEFTRSARRTLKIESQRLAAAHLGKRQSRCSC
jgi:hypothetical protein